MIPQVLKSDLNSQIRSFTIFHAYFEVGLDLVLDKYLWDLKLSNYKEGSTLLPLHFIMIADQNLVIRL